MKHALQYFAVCVLSCFSTAAIGDGFYSRLLSIVGTNYSGALYRGGPGEEVRAQFLIDTNNTAPRLTKSKLSDLTPGPQFAVAGIRLGMTMEQVIGAWGKARAVSLYNHGAPRLTYEDSIYPDAPYVVADVFFHPKTNSVMAIWLTFPRYRWDGKPTASPKVDECVRVLGEPTARNFIPNPFEPRKQPPKHWYCRMVYKQPPVLLYFADGELMGLEVNPDANGVAPAGRGSDDYSISFCLE